MRALGVFSVRVLVAYRSCPCLPPVDPLIGLPVDHCQLRIDGATQELIIRKRVLTAGKKQVKAGAFTKT